MASRSMPGVGPALTAGLVVLLATLAGCDREAPGTGAQDAAPLTAQRKAPTEATRAANEKARASLPMADTRDFELAQRGLIARVDDLVIPADQGGTAWDMTRYGFLDGDAPASVHPGLWRQAKLNNLYGLYEVTDGIYQVRSYDLSNISFIRGSTGWIVIDPLISAETARAALALVNEKLGARPVTTVIYTHSHVDHFGGIKGIVDPADVAAGKVRIVAPTGFMEHAISENVLAGNAMSRRASYMFGRLLPPGPEGQVDTGLGRTTSTGRVTLIPPTDIVSKTGTKLTLDGVDVVFQNTPGAEAPAEMMFYFPQFHALCAAEEASANLHNLYTLRGAQVRSGKLWAQWLDQAILMFGDDLQLVFGSHHWPRWGQEESLTYLRKQRDAYKYIHDQTLRLANEGLTPNEIAEQLKLPESLASEWYDQGFYGTVRHDSKATYQLYLGWFDGNPAHLDPLPPVEAGRRYVEFMGGADALLAKARESYAKGDYRWVAEVVNHLVFADPDNTQARWLQADALEQLGYQAESGPWRNFYLTAAMELREGIGDRPAPNTGSPDIVAALTPEMLLDYLSVRLNGPKAADEDLSINLHFRDPAAPADAGAGRDFALHVIDGVLNYRADRRDPDADLSLSLTRADFVAMLGGQVTGASLIKDGRMSLDGNPLTLRTFGGLFDRFEFWFPIVTP